MTPERFTDWLQGFMEIGDPKTLDERQTQIIKDHLALVFDKVTPDRLDINDIHKMIQHTPYPVYPNQTIPYPVYPNQTTPDWTSRPTIICESGQGDAKLC